MNRTHTLTVELDDEGYARLSLRCNWEGDATDRPCGSHTDCDWPDENTCRCTNADCSCREGDHDDCYEFGTFIENIGTECRTEPTGDCWYEDAMHLVGSEAFDFQGISFDVLVDIHGTSWDESAVVTKAVEP